MLRLQYKSPEDETEHGRDTPDLCPISFRSKGGALIPIVWYVGEVECGHCGFQSTSFQGLHKHFHSLHTKETTDYKDKTNAQGVLLSIRHGSKGRERNATYTPVLAPEYVATIEEFGMPHQGCSTNDAENSKKRKTSTSEKRRTNRGKRA